MNVLEEAILFATKAHEGQKRKMTGIPYILHPLEVAGIIGTISGDLEIMAAGVLHDTIEDCGVDPHEIYEKFGPRVSALVQSETEDKCPGRPAAETWRERKEDSLLMLHYTKDPGVRLLWLGDKLSNMRSFYRSYLKKGNEIFAGLHMKEPAEQGWYYKSIARELTEFSESEAYKEYVSLVEYVFGKDD